MATPNWLHTSRSVALTSIRARENSNLEISEDMHCILHNVLHSFFFIRTSNFDAEAERSYIFWRFEAETFLKMFLNLPGIVFQPISADVTRQTIKEHFLLRYGIKFFFFLEHYKKNCLCNKKTIVTVTQNKPFSIWVNLHCCTFIFLPVD